MRQELPEKVDSNTVPDAATGATDLRQGTPREQAKAYLLSHKELKHLPVRELAERTGLSKDAFARAKKELGW